ncbi:MAG: carboxymuconolactone decarboxylase family protein [Myxococcota bacterium]
MTVRIELDAVPKAARAAMMDLERHLAQCSLDEALLELVRLRVSQINGCAYCIDMHYKNARAREETEARLYFLSVWREVSLYSDRERAALWWAEAVTQLGPTGVGDDVYQRVSTVLTPAEMVDLTLAVVSINGWNRLNAAFRTPAAGYRVGQWAEASTAR